MATSGPEFYLADTLKMYVGRRTEIYRDTNVRSIIDEAAVSQLDIKEAIDSLFGIDLPGNFDFHQTRGSSKFGDFSSIGDILEYARVHGTRNLR